MLACLSCTPETIPETPWSEAAPLDAYPNRVTLHRLNTIELENTIQQLLYSTVNIADALPPDARANGFANNAEALTTSGLFLEALSGSIDAA